MTDNRGGAREGSGRKKTEPATKMVSMRFPIPVLEKINSDRGDESLIKFLLRKAGY